MALTLGLRQFVVSTSFCKHGHKQFKKLKKMNAQGNNDEKWFDTMMNKPKDELVKLIQEFIEERKQLFTKEQVVKIIDDILQYPDQVTDAVTNESTDIGAKELFDLVNRALAAK